MAKFKGFGPKGRGGLLGGKKKQKPPETQANSGYSNSYLSILGGLSEGPIGGLVNGMQSVFIDETPLQNADLSYNFTGVTTDFRLGTLTQDRMPGFADSVNSETTIGLEVKFNLPITRQIINKNCDSITVRVGVTLQEFPDNGGVIGSAISFRISIKEGSGPFVARIEPTISGRYSGLTEFEYQLPVSNILGTVDRFTVKVERLTPTTTTPDKVQQVLNFQSFVESVETKLSYPYTSLFGIKLEASQFSSAPKVTFDVYGRLIQIPSNATVDADGGLTYTGVWNGAFYTPATACSDPAWILWDLLTNNRYGLGRQIKAKNLYRWSFLAISKYCNGLVPDGNGGFERRFLTNFVLEGKEDAYKVIEALRSVFRGFSYFLNGTLFFAADMPGTPVMQFTQADIEDGMFSYARTSLKARHTVAVVTWIDPDDGYKRAIETVEDAEAIQLYGYRPIEISAFGAISRGQARRAGLAILMTEKLETETVTFKVRAFGSECLPGMRIKVADSKRADIRYGGLVADSTLSSVTLDYPVQLEVGVSYTITVMLSNGGIAELPIVNAAGVYDVIQTSTFTSLPLVEGNWIIASSDVQPQLFTVLNRTVVSGSEESMYEITGLQYRGDKYGAIEFDYPLEPRPTRYTAPKVVTKPDSVTVGFESIGIAPNYTYVLIGNWRPPILNGTRDPFVSSYLIEYRLGVEGTWQGTTSTNNLFVEFSGLPTGTYFLRVASVDLSGNSSAWVETAGVRLGVKSTVADFRNRDYAVFVDMA